MKIIRKYILLSFLKPFFISLAAFLVLMCITHFFDYLHTFLEYKPPLSIIMLYLLNRIPEWLVMITPVATLLAVLFSLGGLKRHGEITAISSSGLSIIKAIKPLIFVALIISMSSFFISEMTVPEAKDRADELFLVIRNKQEDKEYEEIHENFTYAGIDNKFFFIDRLSENYVRGFKLIEFFPNTTKEKKRITASQAFYYEGTWHLENGVKRVFSPEDGTPISYVEFNNLNLDIKETPKDFVRRNEEPENMGFISLLHYIRRLEKGGLSARREKVILNHKISFPFSNAIILILGIPIALWSGLKGKTTGFFIALIVSFIYWGTITVGRALGTGGMLPPFLSAWVANIVFLFISLLMMKQIKII
ncbi:MAG: LptF/LptG family permease [Elusimicrobiota bacterium]